MYALLRPRWQSSIVFFFNDTATTEIYTLSLHDALPISEGGTRNRTWRIGALIRVPRSAFRLSLAGALLTGCARSEEHTSELQSRLHLVCRLLLEKKKNG